MEVAHATLTTTSSQRDVGPKQREGLADKFQPLQAGGGEKDIVIAVDVNGKKPGVWVLEGSQWVKRCDMSTDLPEWGVCFCAVLDGLLAMGGKWIMDNHNSPLCYYYSLSQRRWRKLPDMITPKHTAEVVEISPMLVMVVGGFVDEVNHTNTCEVLDMKRGEWFPVKPLPKHIKRVRVAATDGRVFIMGLCGDYTAPNYELLEYQPSSDTYTTVQINRPELDCLQFDNSDMAAVSGKLYLVGETNIEYDITTQHVTQLCKPKAYYNHRGCCAMRGKNILLCGGRAILHWWNGMEEYNTTTRQWKMVDSSLPFTFDRRKSFVVNIRV